MDDKMDEHDAQGGFILKIPLQHKVYACTFKYT